MRILVTGGAGLLGGALVELSPAGVELHITTHRTAPSPTSSAVPHPIDLTDSVAVADLVGDLEPDAVIHTAYSRLDHDVTVRTTESIIDACAGIGAWLVHLSSDAVFDGERAPYVESDEPSPVHDYGRAKARAEREVRRRCPDAAAIRTSLIVRPDGTDPTSAWVVDALKAGEPVRLFTDEVRTPILVDDLARQIWEVVALGRAEASGVWHLAGPERLSRAEIGRRLARRLDLDASLIDPVPSPSDGEPRPRDVSLSTARADAALSVRPQPIGSVAPHG